MEVVPALEEVIDLEKVENKDDKRPEEEEPLFGPFELPFPPVQPLEHTTFRVGLLEHCLNQIFIWLFCALALFGVALIVLFFMGMRKSVTIGIVLTSVGVVLTLCQCYGYVKSSNTAEQFYTAVISPEEAQDLLEKSQDVNPVFNQHIQCYHTERRGSDNIEVTTFETDEPKVFGACYDFGPKVTFVPDDHGMRVIHINSMYRHRDEDTRRDFLRQQEAFIDQHRGRDISHRYSDGYKMEHFPKVILVSNSRKPWYFGSCIYGLCIAIGCSFPWRMLISMFCTDEYLYTNIKEVDVADLNEARAERIRDEKNNYVCEI